MKIVACYQQTLHIISNIGIIFSLDIYINAATGSANKMKSNFANNIGDLALIR